MPLTPENPPFPPAAPGFAPSLSHPRLPARPARAPQPPGDVTFMDLLGVSYMHLHTRDGSELYLTKYGQPFWEHLLPENWYTKEWFEANRERLVGTSMVYRVPTRKIRGMQLDLVVKWSRVGEEVPLDTLTINKFIDAEFNSPFEEFSLVMELRAGGFGLPKQHVKTQKPLAIFVPSERLQLWQTGRSESRIAAKLARHPGVELDILRQYVVLYGWIKGVDVTELATLRGLAPELREELFQHTTARATNELADKGYRVVDMKPAHIIVRQLEDGSLLRQPDGELAYALVDYELLERTPDHEEVVRSVQRRHYLSHMARRFEIAGDKPLPPHLRATNVLGVDYIFGHAESTGGLLWVVGRDPDLFNYFLPERWRRTPKEQLSNTNQVFRTRTKDNINLVWRISRVGDTPWLTDNAQHAHEILEHGFNAPFEEFAHAMDLTRAGVSTIYPRAIYMTGHKASLGHVIADHRRYDQLAHLRTPDGAPAMSKEHDYITIWGYWNGTDEMLAVQDGTFYHGVDAARAQTEGLVADEFVTELMVRAAERLRAAGYEDLNSKPDHLLLSFTPDNQLVLTPPDRTDFRLCNFELLRRLPPKPRSPRRRERRDAGDAQSA